MNEHDKQVMALVNELIKALPGYSPLETLVSDIEQRYSLAKMYSEKGFRDYLVRSIRLGVASLQEVEDLKGIWFQKGRIEVLKELLKIAEQMFNETQKLDRLAKNQKV